jgi:GT2 family glycosyltransferase
MEKMEGDQINQRISTKNNDNGQKKLNNILTIVIVNYKTPELSIDCLQSLAPEIDKLHSIQVIIVDNGSGDDSCKLIQNAIDDNKWNNWTTLVKLDINIGFAGGCNRGWEVDPSADYVLLLNSDTKVHPETISYCYNKMQSDKSIGALSCKLLNEDGSVQNVARRFPSPLRLVFSSMGLPWKLPRFFEWADTEDSLWDRETISRDVNWLGGAFLFLRGDLVRKIGLLDEGFFFFGEDIEFCHRVWKAGFRCHYDSTTKVTHFGARSSEDKRTNSGWRIRQMWHAKYLVQQKCYGYISEAFVRLVDISSYSFRVLWRRIIRGSSHKSYLEAKNILKVIVGDMKNRYFSRLS